MENNLEIDLREIVKKILAKWYWVILAGFVIGLVTFLISFLQPDVYKVTTQFILTEPLYNASFESQYQTTELDRPSEGVIRSIVLNDEIASALYDMWASDSKNGTTLLEFKADHLSTKIGDDGVLVSLIVETQSREQSAEIANTWVDLAIDAVNNTYYGFETDQVGTLKDQMTEALAEVDVASQRLIDFTGSDTSKVLTGELNNFLATQTENNNTIRAIRAAQANVQALVQVLQQEPVTGVVDPDYRLSFLLIQAKVLNASNPENSSTELNIDYSGQGSDKTVGEFIDMVENWATAMSDQVTALENENVSLSTDITELQTQIKALENEASALSTDYQRQLGIYNILATKYDEVRLTIPEGTSGYVNLISKASVPEPDDRLPHNTIRNTLIAAIAGGIIGIAVILVCDWWRFYEEPDSEAEE